LQLDAHFFGSSPYIFHLTNLLLHLVNTLLVFHVLQSYTGAVERSFVVAAFFVVHPLHVESVAWVAERKDVLSTLFFLMTLLQYRQFVLAPSPLRYGGVVLCFVLGLLAKPMLVTLPFVLLLLDIWPLCRLNLDVPSSWTRPLVEKVSLFLLVAGSCWITIQAQHRLVGSESLDFSVRLLHACQAYVMYLYLTIWPVGLAFHYPHPGANVSILTGSLCGLGLFAITLFAWLRRGDRPYLLIGWCWFLGVLVPVIGLVQVGQQAWADRYVYIPHIGLFFAVVWGLADAPLHPQLGWIRRLAIHPAVVAAGLGVCVVLTQFQLSVWRNSSVLWERTLQATRENAVAELRVGVLREHQGQVEQALDHYRSAIRIEPRFTQARTNLAKLLLNLGRPSEARVEAAEAVARQPGEVPALVVLALAYKEEGDVENAETQLQLAIRHGPRHGEAYRFLGELLLDLGRRAEARKILYEARRLAPNDLEVQALLERLENGNGP
jgi:Tfp pilus assembly protein PilF